MANQFRYNLSSVICRYYIIFFLFYISFETPILNMIPTSMTGIVRYGMEVTGYVLLALVIIIRGKISIGKELRIIMFFILTLIINAIINWVNIEIAVLGIRWIIRYAYVFFLLALSRWDNKCLYSFIKAFKIIMIIEIILCCLQIVARDMADAFLVPQYESIIDGINLYSLQGESKWALFASFGRYGEFAYFIMVAIWYWIAEYLCNKKLKRSKILIMLGIWGVILVLSYGRQAVVAVLFSILIFLIVYKKLKITKHQVRIILVALLILLPISIITLSGFEHGNGTINEGMAQRYLSAFSVDFFTRDFNGQGRTWFYTVGLYRLLAHRPLGGFGVGMYGCQTAIQYDQSVHLLLNIPTKFSMDVYYTSIIGQLGMIGLGFFLHLYFSLAKLAKKIFSSDNASLLIQKLSIWTYGVIVCGLITAAFGSSLSDRYFAFYLWCLIGMLYSCSKTKE